MTEEESKTLTADPTGLLSYEYLANNIDSLTESEIAEIAGFIAHADRNGQFTASAARYLHAIDPEAHQAVVNRLVADTIDRDREHRYLLDIMQGIYGDEGLAQADSLCETDNNFRRLYKRLYPAENRL